ncbi:hypothetical protein BGZ49_005099 [Haplosporangium sp. Z 27]|nr:hypothetical protein BGZ49_005099 [Haplosporangium sp. Z 27]
MSSDSISINVRASNQKYAISISLSETVLQLKHQVAEKFDTPAERMRLIYSGRVLKDADLLKTYKIADGHTVHMVRSLAPPPPNPASDPPSYTPIQTATTTTTSSVNTPHTSTFSQDSTTTTNSGALPNPWANLMSGNGGSMGGFRGMANIGGMESSIMTQMMQDPNFAQYMSSMLQNPQVLESMISMNPALRSIGQEARQMLRSQQFQQMICDPDTLRRIAQTGPSGGGSSGEGSMFNPWGSTASMSTSPPSAGSVNPVTGRVSSAPAYNPCVALGGTTGASSMSDFCAQQLAAMRSGARTGTALNSNTSTSSQRQPPPEERFQVQLKQLNEMGFWDPTKNIRALLVSNGNINNAIELLFSGCI